MVESNGNSTRRTGTVAFILHYIIAFRFKETIQTIVNKESAGLYFFNASDIKISLAEKEILVRNARFSCKDTAQTTPH